MRSIHVALVAVVGFALLTATAVLGQKPPEAGSRAAKILQDFDDRLQRIDDLLSEQKPKKAYREAEDLLRKMADRLLKPSLVESYLGRVTALRAIAAYRLGRADEAIWHWQVAVQMSPGELDVDLSAYGEAGALLEANRPEAGDLRPARPAGEVTKIVGEGQTSIEIDGERRAVVSPKKIKAAPPRIPEAARHGRPISVVVRSIIGTDGRPREPRILKSDGEPAMVYAVLDALRQWQYVPARLEGHGPIETYFNLAFNYRRSDRAFP